MSADGTSYSTLAAQVRYEPDKIKGSRFIACAAPVTSEEEASAFLDEVRAKFDDARHVCWAWRLLPPAGVTRSNDDGEPSGSAGRPILAQLEGHELFGLACGVVRYFGGVKLGVGGLMRAYGGAAGQALDRAEIARVDVRVAVACGHPYGDSNAVQALLARYGLEPRDAEYGTDVRFTCDVPAAEVDAFRSDLVEATAARARSSVEPEPGA
ncbi:MAG: YigZ family protein [Planctomycetota bacterium]